MKYLPLLLALLTFNEAVYAQIYKKIYPDYTLWLDCNQHGAIAFEYAIGKDFNNTSKKGLSFKKDKTVPDNCQPGKTATFKGYGEFKNQWDRGHLRSANQADKSKESIKDTFFITNMLPQKKEFNRNGGAWYTTELTTECYREDNDLTVWGGVIWGNNVANDFFVESHNIKTPDFWWKLILKDNNDFIAWIMPNDKNSKHRNLSDYIVSYNELISKLEFLPPSLSSTFASEHFNHDTKPHSTWALHTGCAARRS